MNIQNIGSNNKQNIGVRSMIRGFAVASLILFSGITSSVEALVIDLFDHSANLDGVKVVAVGASTAPEINLDNFDTATGTGMITVTISGEGPHHIGMFVDPEIDETTNGFSNEAGITGGIPVSGQTWEIGEPGFQNGDIFDNFCAGALDNEIAQSPLGPTSVPDDMAMAVAHDFSLAANETAIVKFTLTTSQPASGFFLKCSDPDSTQEPSALYLSSMVIIETPPPANVVCDFDDDSDVDRDDLAIIGASRNSPASGPADPMDIDGDGIITALDMRKCVLECTRPRCATE